MRPSSSIMSKPGAERADVAEIAARNDDRGRAPPSRTAGRSRPRSSSGPRCAGCSSSWRGRRLLPRRAAVTIAMQPSKSVSSASTCAPLASGCTQLRRRHLAARQDHDRRNAGRRGVGRERRRGVAGGRAGDGANAAAVRDHLLDDRHEHGHAEVLERPGVRVAAQLDPEIVEAELAGRAARPRTCSCRLRPSTRRSRRAARGRPIPSCPTRPSRTATCVRL